MVSQRCNDRRNARCAIFMAALMVGGLGWAGVAAAQGGMPPRARPVIVSLIQKVEEAPTFIANGLLKPTETSLLSADAPGRVEKIHVQEGDMVQEGQVVAELTNTSIVLDRKVLQAQVKEAEAQLALSRQKTRRAEALFKQKLASAEQFENEAAATKVAEAKVQSTMALLERMEEQLKMMVVRAPISGQVVRTDLEIGQWVTTNTPIFEIYNYANFEMLAGVPGRFITKINPGTKVSIRLPELSIALTGVIEKVVRHVDSSSGNFVLRIQVDNPDGVPLSGLLAQVDVPVGFSGNLLSVPRDAIVRQAGRTQVVVVRDGKAAIVPVKVQGNLNNSQVIVDGGLRAQEEVVVRGNERLFPGAPLRVTGKL